MAENEKNDAAEAKAPKAAKATATDKAPAKKAPAKASSKKAEADKAPAAAASNKAQADTTEVSATKVRQPKSKAAPKADAPALRPGVLKVHHLRPVPGAAGSTAAFRRSGCRPGCSWPRRCSSGSPRCPRRRS